MALLEVRDLTVAFTTDDGVVGAVDGVSYDVEAGRTLGIVGESGSGKSVSSTAIMGLTRFLPNVEVHGSARFDGLELTTASDAQLRALRGSEIALIFQDPLTALDPYYRVGDQLVETIRAHRQVPRAQARRRAIEMLGSVGIPDAGRRVDSYPHEFSGGMRQRVMIALAIVNEPRLLIADEPTTALDVTVQAQILELLRTLQEQLGMALVMITHDLGVVAEIADDVAVMYAGRVVERGSVRTIFRRPEHPYTWGLLRSAPRLDSRRDEPLTPIEGRPASLLHRPSGCAFHPRCPHALPAHARVDPGLEPTGSGDEGHVVACLLEPERRRALWRELQDGASPSPTGAR